MLNFAHEHGFPSTVQPVNLATLVRLPSVTVGCTFTEPANSCDIINDHNSTIWPPAHLESSPVSHLVLCFT